MLFEDPRLRPPPDPDDLVREARSAVASQWEEGAPAQDRGGWLLRQLSRELLGRAWAAYRDPIRGLLRRQVWSDADVDELVQAAAVRSVERLGELVARPRPLFEWLCQLARQARVDWLRRGGGRGGPPPDGRPDPADSATTPTQAERRARVRDLYDRVLAELDPADAALLRTTAGGVGPAEVAAKLGEEPVTVRVRLHRARLAAARVWQRLFPEAAAELAALGVIPPPPTTS